MSVFVKGGPDIPDDLVRAHEDGEVVLEAFETAQEKDPPLLRLMDKAV